MNFLRFTGRSGSALPGLVMEKLYPNFLQTILRPVEKQVILITGTNGKTTTTKIIVAGLRGAGLRIITNTTGSNMTRGIIAALIEDMTYFGTLKPTDWFVFEVDEAYAPVFTQSVSPKILTATNVMRDQLDRYGEIDNTAQLIKRAAIKSDVFIYNNSDPLLVDIAVEIESSIREVIAFGSNKKLHDQVINEQTLQGEAIKANDNSGVILEQVQEVLSGQKLTIITRSGTSKIVDIPVKGFHNALNATASLAVLQEVVPNHISQSLKAVKNMPTPFGRGERLHLNNKVVTVALVKNPSGFTNNITTFIQNGKPDAVLFVVNDQFADGRDVSWLWDVSFQNKLRSATEVITSGIRRYDMALRLQQDGITSKPITGVAEAVNVLMESSYNNVVIIPTYTALFEVRSALSRYGKVPRIW